MSMQKDYSRVLIDDHVLPDKDDPFRPAGMDLHMMTLLSKIERTLRRWENLLDASDWEIIKIWGKDSGREQLIECQLKD